MSVSDLHIPQHGLNISRGSLPQVKSQDIPDYLRWLASHKQITSIHTTMPVSSLYPAQGDFNQAKIRTLMTKKTESLKQPIIVSGDHYVIDGHHRWLALMNIDPTDTIPVILLHAKALDVIAATHEYPKSFMKPVLESFRSIMEEQEKHAVLAFGRMNPPTTGHEKLVNKVHEVAKSHNAHHEVVLSHSQDEKKNPLPQEQKIKHAKRFFPKTNVTASTKESPTIFHQAAKLHKAGYKHLHVVAGADRVKEFHDNLHKYNGKFDEKGNGYHFKSITVHSAGARDPDAEGTEGMSASKMREHAHKGQFKEFKKGIPSHVSHEHAKELYHDVRKGMGHVREGFVPRAHHSEVKGLSFLQSKKKPYYDSVFGHYVYPDGSHKTKEEHEAIQKKNLKEEVLLEHVHDSSIFKAVFLAGVPGSGKDFVLKKALDGHGLTEINSDNALQFLKDKSKLDKKMPEHQQEKRGVIRDKAKSMSELRQRLALHGRNGLIINNSGASHEKIKQIKDMLDGLGYDSKMVFVDSSDNVSRNRNVERAQRGGRVIPEATRAKKWREAQDARVKLSKLFGGEHYHEFNNDDDLRYSDPDVHSQKQQELDKLSKEVKKFTHTPPKSEQAQEWIRTNLTKLAKQPIGNKKQQASVTPPASDSQAAQDAKKLGLQYYGYGRYGKSGRISHFSLHGKLIEKKAALKSKDNPSPKKLNEAFEEFINEENEDVNLRLRDYLEDSMLVGGFEGTSEAGILFTEERGLSRVSSCVGLGRLRDRGREQITESEEASQITSQEGEKVSLQEFKERLVTLSEGEPTLDTGEEGGSPFGMGTGGKEELDMTNGGISTKVPKKTLKDFRLGKKS